MGGEFALAQPATLDGVVLLNGSLGVTGTVTSTGTVTLAGGELHGDGSLEVRGALGVERRLDDRRRHDPDRAGRYPILTGFVDLSGRTLRNEGALRVDGPDAYWSLGSGARLDNAATLTLTDGSAIYDNAPAQSPALVNTGTITRAAGTGDATVNARIDNRGAITALGGVLTLYSGTSRAATGSFGGGAGTVVLGSGAYQLAAGATLAGDVRADGTMELLSTVISPGSLTLAGTLTGPGRLDVAGALTWTAGAMTGPGLTRILRTGSLVIAGDTTIDDDRTLRIEGTARWLSQRLIMGHGTLLENVGTFDLEAQTGSIDSFFRSGAEIHNSGTMRRMAGTGPVDIELRSPMTARSTCAAAR